MSKTTPIISENQYAKYVSILYELGKYKYLLRDEFHLLCAPQIKGITNFYPYLKKMEAYKFIEAYRVFDDRLERIFDSNERNKQNVIYRLSHFGWELLRSWGRLKVEVTLPDGEVIWHELEEPNSLKFNSHINHNIIITQALCWTVEKIKRDRCSNILFFTDYLLRRVMVKEGGKIPDFLIYLTSADGNLKRYWCECENTRKKTKNIKEMASRLSLLPYQNLIRLVFYPKNAKTNDGFFISHRKNIEAAARNYSLKPMKLFLFEFYLADSGRSKSRLLGGKYFMRMEDFEVIPSLFSLLGAEISTTIWDWLSDAQLEGNQTYHSLFQSFHYFISKNGKVYSVAPVVLKSWSDYGDVYEEDEIDMSRLEKFNSRPAAIQKAAEFIQERYGRDKLLRSVSIYLPNTYKTFKNLENAKINHLERQILEPETSLENPYSKY